MTAPLFILAPPRSFTSVTCGMIGTHPELLGVAEINLFARETLGELNEFYSYRPRYQHGLLRVVAELGLGEQTEDNIDAAADLLDELAEVSTSQLFHDLIEWAAPKAIVDKSPLYVINDSALSRIGENFPDARFLHLLRHPRGTCESIVKLQDKLAKERSKFRRRPQRQGQAQAGANKEPNADNMWLHPHQRVMTFLENIPAEQQLRVHGEELLSDPPQHLPAICEWLGVDSSAASIDAMLHPENSPFACLGPSNAQFGNDPDYLENPALRPYSPKDFSLEGSLAWDDTVYFSDALKRLANELGYE